MTSLDSSKVVLREGLSPDFVALMTPDPTPSAHILRPLQHTSLGGREREGEMVEPFKNHSISCARGRAWTARAEDHTRKR